MKIIYIFCAALSAQMEAISQKNNGSDKVNPIHKPNPDYKPRWSDTAVNYRVVFTGKIGQGKDDVRKEDSDLDVFVIMNNGLVVPLKNNGSGAITNSDDPERKVFHLNIHGESKYVTDLNVRLVELIHMNKGFKVNQNQRNIDYWRQQNLTPDEWDFDYIQISAKLYRKNPATGVELLIAEKEILNKRPLKKMTYGIWTSAEPPRYFNPPQQVKDAEGSITARVLTGKDDMKKDPAYAAILVQTGSGNLSQSLGRYVGLPAFSFWNYDGFGKMEGKVKWRGVGKVGIKYQYGDHGLFDRDDWEVKALLVDFVPDFLQGNGIFFRNSSNYIQNNTSAYLIKFNGDGSGVEMWAPFLSGLH